MVDALEQDQPDAPQADGAAPLLPRRRRWWLWLLLGLTGLLVLGLAGLWFAREAIVSDIIDQQLEALDLPVTYEVEKIGTGAQVLRNIVVGDPARPDLTAESIEVAIEPRFGLPGLRRITLVKPRLYGSYRSGKLSFGSLDKVLFKGSKEPFRLPDLDIAVKDGRALMRTDLGDAGIKLDGEGMLRGGFKGELAVAAPKLEGGGCTGQGASLYGKLAVRAEKPEFSGPLRMAGLTCPGKALKLGAATALVTAVFDPRLDGAEGSINLILGQLAIGSNRAAGTDATVRFVWRDMALTADYSFDVRRVATPDVRLASLGSDGVLRASEGFDRIAVEGKVGGIDVKPGKGLDEVLASGAASAAGTLGAPLLGQLHAALLRESRTSRFEADFIHRQTGVIANLVVPRASLVGTSGQALVSVSRFQLTAGGKSVPRFSGNFVTGGPGLPRLSGRMERDGKGGIMANFAMAEYRAGTASLSLPVLKVVQTAGGALGFAGRARMSGDLPGGAAQNLELPIDGNWSAARGLAVWRSCTPVSFDSLSLANLTLARKALTLCPVNGRPILSSGAGGMRMAAGTPALDLSGRLGQSPIRLVSGPVGFSVPGNVSAKSLDITLGPAKTASRFRIDNLSARIGPDVAGKFAGTTVLLSAVPLDLYEAAGDWRFANGRLSLSNGAFQLKDRTVDARFKPLIARGATLSLADNRIVAEAIMREPQSDREIVTTRIVHNLASGVGNADLKVGGILFDKGLQPDTLSALALGIIANASGTVRGEGLIDWNPQRVASSGTFTTYSLDFAAAFGPVQGASGTIHFTDLLGMVTAPDQRIKFASINPGIEANDGELSYELRPDGLLLVNGANWPFLDGKLTLEPTRMVLGASEVRRFTLTIEGLNAARFVERLELGNIAATGVFDGSLPLIFDENGGRIEGGRLTSRPPGGNVSYVGQLTYKDLSTMANFAFDALKSIDYRQMGIELDGALEGELVTRVSFDGIRQGQTAKRNLITRQIGKLPLRFNINLRAPFMKLTSSMRSLYDPAYIRDPRAMGLIGADGKRLPERRIIQPPVSEKKP